VKGLGDLLTLDDRSLLVAQGRYEMVKFVYLVARWSRQWTLDQATATYTSADNWKFGLETSFTF
ncbi:MAG TPA: hypothetical protein VFH51_08450, partial [Myxococcota bacterium]|nr:hypothetical protein [Myxococcota bacterium]